MVNGIESLFKGLVVEDDLEYQFIVECNVFFVDIDNEIIIIYNFI